MTIHVTLEQVYTGITLPVAFLRTRVCTHCAGTGASDPQHLVKCGACGGSGRHQYITRSWGSSGGPGGGSSSPDDHGHAHDHDHGHHDTTSTAGDARAGAAPRGDASHHPPPFTQLVHTVCHHCEGEGSIATEKCPVCGGSRMRSELGACARASRDACRRALCSRNCAHTAAPSTPRTMPRHPRPLALAAQVNVTLPAGVPDGHTVTLKGEVRRGVVAAAGRIHAWRESRW